MTINEEIPIHIYTGNGTATEFSYTFTIFDETDIVLTLLTIASGIETNITSNYSVNDTLKKVTYPVSGSPLTSAYKLVISRNVPDEQDINFTSSGAFNTTNITESFDKVTMNIQEVNEVLSRCVKWKISTDPITTTDAEDFLGGGSGTTPGSTTWGDITGTLSNQTDLNSALAGKSSTSHNHSSTYSDISHNHSGTYSDVSHNHSSTYSNKVASSTSGNFVTFTDASGTIGSSTFSSASFASSTHDSDHSNTYQAKDTELTALAGTTSASDTFPYYTGSGTASTTALTSTARTLLDDSSTSTMRTTLGIDDIAIKKSNLTASVAPAVTDDSGDGYAVGSFWFDNTAEKAYVCVDAGVGAAIWKEITITEGGGSSSWTTLTDKPASLTAIGAVTAASNTMAYYTSSDTASTTTCTDAARVFLSQATYADMVATLNLDPYANVKTNLGATTNPAVTDDGISGGYYVGSLWINTVSDEAFICVANPDNNAVWKSTTAQGSGSGTYQDLDTELTAIAGLTSSADTAPYFTGSGTAALMTVTSTARSLMDDSSTSGMRTTLGLEKKQIDVTMGDGTTAPSTGSKGFLTIPIACTITNWYVTGDASGSCVIDIKRSGTSIVGGSGNKPTLSSAQRSNAAVASWTSVAIAANDELEFNLDSVTTCKRINLMVVVTI